MLINQIQRILKSCSTHLAAAWRTVMRGCVNKPDPPLIKTSRGTRTSFHSMLLIGSPHWERTNDSSFKPWMTWGCFSEPKASTKAVMISEVTETQSGPRGHLAEPAASLLVLIFDDVMKFRTFTKTWLAKELTNRLGSFCRWRRTLMSPADGTSHD